MRVRIGEFDVPWSSAQGMWFYTHNGEEFEVVATHDGLNQLFEVDVSHLAAAGDIGVTRAFVPAAFAEEVMEDTAPVLSYWNAAS